MSVPSSHEAFIRNNTPARSLDQQASDETLPPTRSGVRVADVAREAKHRHPADRPTDLWGRTTAEKQRRPLTLDAIDESDITAGAKAMVKDLGPWAELGPYQDQVRADLRNALKAIRDRHL